VKMIESVKCIYFITIIFLAVTGSESKQVSGMHVLIITAHFTLEYRNMFICTLHSFTSAMRSGLISKQFRSARPLLPNHYMKGVCFFIFC
jgi:hypothetical protein